MGKALGTKSSYWEHVGNPLRTWWEHIGNKKDLKLNHHHTPGFRKLMQDWAQAGWCEWQKNSFMIRLRFFLVMSLPMKLHILCKQLISMSSSGLLLCMRLGDLKNNYKDQFFFFLTQMNNSLHLWVCARQIYATSIVTKKKWCSKLK